MDPLRCSTASITKSSGSSVAQYTDRDSQPAPIVTWLETGDWQTKKMTWPSDPRDILIDRRHILVVLRKPSRTFVRILCKATFPSAVWTINWRWLDLPWLVFDCQSLAREEQQVSDATKHSFV